MEKNVLAVGAHPDDIEIGCGGTLLSLGKNGYNIYLVIFTNGENWEDKDRNIRIKEQERASSYLNVKKTFYLNYPDGLLNKTPKAIDTLSKIISKINPDLIFTHYYEDNHQDHKSVFEITCSATKNRSILQYESVTSRNFKPNSYYNITSLFSSKIQLVSKHESQVKKYLQRQDPLKEKIELFNKIHGINSGVQYAEAFSIERCLIDKNLLNIS